MTQRSRVGMFLALVLGTGGAVHRTPVREPPQTVAVFVARHDLPMGVPIGSDDVAVRELPREMVPPGAVSAGVGVIGRTPRERILSDEMLREERLARADAGVGLNAIIAPGKRAMSITVPPAAVAEVAPGNVVDVLVAAGTRTEAVARQLQVLAVGDGTSAITVELTLDEAQAIVRALGVGKRVRPDPERARHRSRGAAARDARPHLHRSFLAGPRLHAATPQPAAARRTGRAHPRATAVARSIVDTPTT